MTEDSRKAVGGISLFLLLIAFLLGSLRPSERDDGWVEGPGEVWRREAPQNDAGSIGYRRGKREAIGAAAWVVGGIGAVLLLILATNQNKTATPQPDLSVDRTSSLDSLETPGHRHVHSDPVDLHRGGASETGPTRSHELPTLSSVEPHGKDDATPEDEVSIEHLRRIASQNVDNGWLVAADLQCFWTTVRRLHADASLDLNWQDATDAALAVFTAASTLADDSRRPLPCHELGRLALPDLTAFYESSLPGNAPAHWERHIGDRVACIAFDAGLILHDPSRVSDRLDFMELGDFLALDGVGQASGWSVSHNLQLIWSTWRALCDNGMLPRQAESVLFDIIHAAEFAENGIGTPMTQGDLLIWCISQLPTGLADDRAARIADLRHGFAAAIAARVIWFHASD